MITEQWHLCFSFPMNGLKPTYGNINQCFVYIKTLCQLKQGAEQVSTDECCELQCPNNIMLHS